MSSVVTTGNTSEPDFHEIEEHAVYRFRRVSPSQNFQEPGWKEAYLARENQVVSEWEGRIRPQLRQSALVGNWAAQEYLQACDLSLSIAKALHDALHSDGIFNKLAPWFWMHQNPSLLNIERSHRGFCIDETALAEVAARYLQHTKIHVDRMDWLLLDGMVFALWEKAAAEAYKVLKGEMGDIARGVADGSVFKFIVWRAGFIIFGVVFDYVAPLALVYYLATHTHQVSAALLLAVFTLWQVWRVATYPARYRLRRKARTAIQNLSVGYRKLADVTIHTSTLRSDLAAASAAGVHIGGAISTIVDRRLTREKPFIP